jgi:hypothetical protein
VPHPVTVTQKRVSVAGLRPVPVMWDLERSYNLLVPAEFRL